MPLKREREEDRASAIFSMVYSRIGIRNTTILLSFVLDYTVEAHEEANLFSEGGVRGSVYLSLALCSYGDGFAWKARNSS